MLHILLVEDNAADVLMVREACRTSPIAADLVIAYDGEQALKFMNDLNFKPDFIILDINLPKFDGFSLLERYRATNGPPVVVFSGSKNQADRDRALELGAQEYAVKPMSFRPFVETVHGILERLGGMAARVS